MIVAIIPAKLSSKRLKNKNMSLVNGKPLIQYTINYAKKSTLLDDIYVSTDSAFGWDGSYNGKLVQEGAYTWVLRYVSCENIDGWQEKTGHVNLLK